MINIGLRKERTATGAVFPLLILTSLIYVPGTHFGNGLPTFHVEDLAILIGGIYFLIANSQLALKNLFSGAMGRFITIYCLLIFWFQFTTIIHIYTEDNNILIFGALFKAISLLRGVSFALIIVACVKNYSDIYLLNFGIMIMAGAQVAVCTLQKFNISNINEWLTPRYSLVIESSEYSLAGIRTDGTFGNPNHAAVGLVAFGIVTASYYFGRRNFGSMKIVSLCLLVCIMLSEVFLNQSRAGTSTLFAGLLIIQLFYYRRISSTIYIGIGVLIITAMVAPYILKLDNDIQYRFSAFKGWDQLFTDDSMASRTETWKAAIGVAMEDPILGKGLSGYISVGFFDSGYVDYLYTAGIVGVCLYVALAIYVMYYFKREAVFSNSSPEIYSLEVASCAIGFSMLVVSISHPLLYQDKLWLMYLTVILTGFISNRIRKTGSQSI